MHDDRAMGDKSGSAQRARKKHEKEQKRRKAVAQKRQAKAASAARPAASRALGPVWDAAAQGIEGLAAQSRVLFYEAVHRVADFACIDCGAAEELPDALWTAAKVVALETAALVDRLARLGVTADRDAFVAATSPFRSAVAYAREAWLPLLPETSDVHARDFACLAACELWKRWRPEPPSHEMLLDALLPGDDRARHGDDTAAIEHWLRFWSLLLPLLTPEVRTTPAADALVGGGGGLFNWASDLSMAAMNGEVADPLKRRVAGALREIVAQFTAEPPGWALPLLQDRALLLYQLGERDEAERTLSEQIAAHPDSAGGYVMLSDFWAQTGDEGHAQTARALAILEEAAARPVKDGKDWDLEPRLKDLRARLASAEREAGATKR
jgi:hypothetical protein